MFEELKEDFIVNKVGGRFRLTTLVQKRMVALNHGARPLVDVVGEGHPMETVLREIEEEKIFLDDAGNVQTAVEDAEEAVLESDE